MKINFNTLNFYIHRQNKPQKQKKAQDIFVQNPIKTYSQFNPNNNITFGAKRCSVANFKVKELKNLRCPVCSQIILNEEQQMLFTNSVINKRGKDLVEALEFWEDERNIVKNSTQKEKISLFRPQEQKVVNIIKQLALQYPTLALNELVALKAKSCLESLIKDQMEVVSELEQYIQENVSSDTELINLKKIIKEQKEAIKGEDGKDFKRKKFIYAISSTVSDVEVQNNINEIARKLPNSTNDVNSFFVKYSQENKSSKEIAHRLIHPANPTAEHLRPKSKGGPDSLVNYICDCTNCNEKRGNISFNEWQKTVPNFQEKLQNYLEDVQKALDDDKLPPDYDNYIKDVIATISTLSKGAINLKIPDSQNQDKIQQNIVKRKKELDHYNQIVNDLIKVKKEKKKELNSLEAYPHYRTIIQYQTIKDDLTILNAKIKTLRNQIAEENAKREKGEPHNTEELELELEKTISERNLIESKKELIGRVIDKLINFDSQIEETKSLLARLQSIDVLIQKYETQLNEEQTLKNELKSLEEESNFLFKRCRYLKDNGFSQSRSNYEKYQEMCALMERSKIMLQANKSKKMTSAQKETEKIIEIAQNSILANINTLKEENDVEYFLNIETIEEIHKQKIKIKQKLQTFSSTRELLEEQKEAFERISSGKTLQEVEEELKMLKTKKETVQKILNFKILRNELSNLEDEIAYNLRILNHLRNNYRTMSNEDFRQQIDTLYLKAVR